ncbi:DUF433 domain-containing protein [Candidatus Thiothrix phosphatis]|uniref:DUF433 domain-containing protein n=1 Tax=Candidatus Thiothrix phosphatis TaxID=3112415 RepID=UPI002D7805A8|nr:DUF433 domain-containing protein [Candidatus Thiothrix sp. Deng01]
MGAPTSNRITIEAGKRSGKPCISGLRIAVADVLGWLAAGMSTAEILEDFPELEADDVTASLQFAASREHLPISSRLSQSEIESLRQEMKAAADDMRKMRSLRKAQAA